MAHYEIEYTLWQACAVQNINYLPSAAGVRSAGFNTAVLP
jgi:hypothetical protein